MLHNGLSAKPKQAVFTFDISVFFCTFNDIVTAFTERATLFLRFDENCEVTTSSLTLPVQIFGNFVTQQNVILRDIEKY